MKPPRKLQRCAFLTLDERAERVGGACISEVATVEGHSQKYALGASVLGLMQDFIFQETGLAEKPGHASTPKIVIATKCADVINASHRLGTRTERPCELLY